MGWRCMRAAETGAKRVHRDSAKSRVNKRRAAIHGRRVVCPAMEHCAAMRIVARARIHFLFVGHDRIDISSEQRAHIQRVVVETDSNCLVNHAPGYSATKSRPTADGLIRLAGREVWLGRGDHHQLGKLLWAQTRRLLRTHLRLVVAVFVPTVPLLIAQTGLVRRALGRVIGQASHGGI